MIISDFILQVTPGGIQSAPTLLFSVPTQFSTVHQVAREVRKLRLRIKDQEFLRDTPPCSLRKVFKHRVKGKDLGCKASEFGFKFKF